MAEKVLLIADPGIDTAFAIALALNDPNLEVLALAASAGNVNADMATRNAHIVIEQIDPPRWPRIGSALPVAYDYSATDIHGPDGLGGIDLPCVRLHHSHPSDRLIADTLRQYPGEVAVLVMGPTTMLARALDRDPEISRMISKLIVVGGTWHEPGDAGPVSEFHFACDPPAARQVINGGVPVTLLPLDVTRKMLFSPGDIRTLGKEGSRTATFLRKVVPMLLSPTASRFGIEGVHLNDALAVVALAHPDVLTLKTVSVDVETRSELTRGMSVLDTRWATTARPNTDVAVDVDIVRARHYIQAIMSDPLA